MKFSPSELSIPFINSYKAFSYSCYTYPKNVVIKLKKKKVTRYYRCRYK